MTLEEKYRLFAEGRLKPDLTVDRGDLASYDIRPSSRTAKTLFEPGSSMESQVIGPTGKVFIGAGSYMNDGGYVRKNVFIGRFCSIGRRVTLGAGAHRMTGLSTSPALRGANPPGTAEKMSGPLEIGSDVWIGDGVVVSPGIRIGVGAVIGANAVVTRDVAPYDIVVGLPARPLRCRFDKKTVDALLATRWWEHDADDLRACGTGDISGFLDMFSQMKPRAAVHATLACR